MDEGAAEGVVWRWPGGVFFFFYVRGVLYNVLNSMFFLFTVLMTVLLFKGFKVVK